MAKSRTPTKILELKGAFDKDPKRRRKDVDPNYGIGHAPKNLTIKQKECWDYIVENALPGVMGNSDRPMLELLAVMLYMFRHRRKVSINQKIALAQRIECGLAKLGMTPSDRSKVTAIGSKEEKDDPWDDF